MVRDPEPGSIPHLPPEIWIMILEHLPPSFFQQDTGRLMLSKRWYSLAFPIFYPRIEYTPRVISRLVHRKSRSLDKSYALLCKSLRSINIVLDGLGSPGPGPGAPWVFGRGVGPGLALGSPDLACFNTPSNLTRFCLMLLEFRELKAVRFAARWQNREWPADPLQADYLCIRSLEPYVTLLTHVTSLDLDLCGTDIVNDLGVTVHFCSYLRPLLSRLRSLRLRLRSICQPALMPVEGAPVTLGELALNLYLGRVSDNNPKLNASRACPTPGSWEWTSPLGEMRARIKALVKLMAEPRRAEMAHLAPSGEVHVWDASTDLCVRHGSEKPRQFPLCFDSQGPCFPEVANMWAWDGSDLGHSLSEPDEPEESADGEVGEQDGVEEGSDVADGYNM